MPSPPIYLPERHFAPGVDVFFRIGLDMAGARTGSRARPKAQESYCRSFTLSDRRYVPDQERERLTSASHCFLSTFGDQPYCRTTESQLVVEKLDRHKSRLVDEKKPPIVLTSGSVFESGGSRTPVELIAAGLQTWGHAEISLITAFSAAVE